MMQCRLLLLLAACSAVAIALAAGPEQHRLHRRPIARRQTPIDITANGADDVESVEMDSKAGLIRSRASSLLALKEATATGTDSQGKSCPGGVTCGEKADNLIWDQACWDCLEQYQEFYCEKSSLTSPNPTYVDACAREGQFRGAFCKKFAETTPPQYYEDCFFPGSEYKQVYCERLKLKGTFKSECASDSDVGPNYCEGFAVRMDGYIECHGWPGFMMLYCEMKQNATIWDATCANHNEVGANYCEDFAIGEEIKPDCIKYSSYLTLYCDAKASKNVTEDTCASNEHTAGMYCQQLALKKNGFKPCWSVPQFDATYCAEISWGVAACESMAGKQMPQRPSAGGV